MDSKTAMLASSKGKGTTFLDQETTRLPERGEWESGCGWLGGQSRAIFSSKWGSGSAPMADDPSNTPTTRLTVAAGDHALPNVRVNPARGGRCCKAGLRRWYTPDAARPYSACRSGSGLNEGLGSTVPTQHPFEPRVLFKSGHQIRNLTSLGLEVFAGA